MAIGSVDYPSPVTVNGYRCRNCSDVSLAKKHIDPEHPKSGPDNRDAATDPTRKDSDPTKIASARKAAAAAAMQIVSYSPYATRTAVTEPGRIFAIRA